MEVLSTHALETPLLHLRLALLEPVSSQNLPGEGTVAPLVRLRLGGVEVVELAHRPHLDDGVEPSLVIHDGEVVHALALFRSGGLTRGRPRNVRKKRVQFP